MPKKCIYCKIILDDNCVVDVCRRCGFGVWGEKMFGAIISNMEGARENGDLYQGSVSYASEVKKTKHSWIDEALENQEKFSAAAVEEFEEKSEPIINEPVPSLIPKSDIDMMKEVNDILSAEPVLEEEAKLMAEAAPVVQNEDGFSEGF